MPDGVAVELGPGEFFGEVALLTDSPRNARVRARTDVRCLAISRHVFTLLLDAQPIDRRDDAPDRRPQAQRALTRRLSCRRWVGRPGVTSAASGFTNHCAVVLPPLASVERDRGLAPGGGDERHAEAAALAGELLGATQQAPCPPPRPAPAPSRRRR